MSLARKLLNKSISFEKKKAGLDEVYSLWGGTHNDGKIIIEYQIPINQKQIESVTKIITPREFLDFIVKAVNLRLITFFGYGETLQYTREEILQEIKERGMNFFTDGDEKSINAQIALIPEYEPPKPVRKSRERVSDAISDEKTDNSPQLGILRMPKIKRS